MARLRVRLRGKNIQDIQLAPDRSYLAGRREDCDIVLAGNEKGISREHFKLSYSEDKWQLELLSKYNDVLVDGEKIQHLTLEGQKLFYLGPYEFEYSEMSSELVPAGGAGRAPEPLFKQAFTDSGEVEKTFIGASQSVPYIKVVTADGENIKELFKLEGGDTWIAGRDSSCDILIRDQRVSRRQFEVRRQDNQFLIMDLGSVNGTLLNGNPVSSSDLVIIKSGDAISVLDNHLYFELHDPEFKSRMEMVKANTPSPLVATAQGVVPANNQYVPHAMTNYGYPQQGHPVSYPQHEEPKKFDFEKHRIKLFAGAILIIAVAYVFSGPSETGPKPASQAGAQKPQDVFNKLSPEQQILVKQTYLLAKNLYMQGKYELAKSEVVKIYEIVPDYEDTKDIERLANEALIIQQQKQAAEDAARAKAEAEEKIQTQLALCKTKINRDMTMDQLEECFSPVLQFDPNHSGFAALRAQVEEFVSQKQVQESQKAEHQSQVQKLKGLFSRAESSQRENQYLKAIKEFQSVANSGLPDPNDLKAQARRQIAAIQQTLKQKTDQFATEAEQAYKDQKLRDAILTLRKSIEVDPNNEEAKDKVAQYTTELKKQMMQFYQEGILEESYGNVEGSENKPGAKDKWKKIMELDIPDGEYYGKAKMKLKKYGAL